MFQCHKRLMNLELNFDVSIRDKFVIDIKYKHLSDILIHDDHLYFIFVDYEQSTTHTLISVIFGGYVPQNY